MVTPTASAPRSIGAPIRSVPARIPTPAVVRVRGLALLLAVLAAACDEAPTAVSSGDETSPSTAVVASGQTANIEALVLAGEAAWAAKDPAAYAALFADDAEFISPLGTYLHGREAIRAQHVLLYNGPFLGSTLDIQIGRVAFLTGTIAVVDLNYTLTDYQFLVPGLYETEPGIFRLLVRWVVEKRGGTWLVVAHQMTQVAPTP